MKRSLLIGSLIGLVAQFIQLKRNKNVFRYMNSKQKVMYLTGGLLSTGAVALAYLTNNGKDSNS